MFFRYDKGRRKAIDLDGIFSGPCFMMGGSPQLLDAKDLLLSKPVMKIAMNNTATVIRPELWVGADRAENYSSSILLDPAPMKFAFITRRDCNVNGKKWMDLPNTYFLSSKKMKFNEFFLKNRDFSWDKNVFMLTVQLAHRLGFNPIYLVGCSFVIDKGNQYCYETHLNDNQIEYNQGTYNSVLRQLKEVIPFAKKAGLEIISCTPGSKANDIVQYIELDRAINSIEVFDHDTINCRHPAK